MSRRDPGMRKKRLTIFILASAVLLLAGTAAWRQWTFVPIPSYVPSDSQSRRVAKKTIHSWGRPCVYARFETSRPLSIVAAELRKSVSELREWEQFSERTSEEIFAEIKERRGQDTAISHQLVALYVAPILGRDFALRTERPFVLLSWFGHEDPATHHSITARLIDTGDNGCIIELWDFRMFDH